MDQKIAQPLDHGIQGVDVAKLDLPGPNKQLFGHVTLVQSYDIRPGMPGNYPTYQGTWALVSLRDKPGKTVAVITKNDKLLAMLSLALATGNLMYFSGRQDFTPYLPLGGTTSLEVYEIYEVNVYNQH